ncbi:glutamine--fructose-6-phosphate aminotransferase [endosymbiont 'TC1' of Trimyema compressum]|uniref:glutamine--fructose-6-phosphate transaminase (isomerizing) n=1 Tax=endosymbiont 'TC1' of Trimyema compressum TaxID=243899 RepID=UPI0007F06CB6|nr:glutamine--fructose-6-phosphate transaminase (isomerizing) [endosymbiont 'TC1' of Trimyema compressum]AMP20040.1 glutamine--fructose-6-phosphate aminotransferase [endosymbiont 'TC1' of Trimyema compressum]
MCGIVGYFGKREAKDILMNGLFRLEYRGYDSAGIALFCDGDINVTKAQGRLKELEIKLNCENRGSIGIGHTRWATHGKPSDENSHPHMGCEGTFCVVHNGIIENYMELKEALQEKGCDFLSETDTEVIPNLLEVYNTGDFLETVQKVVSMLEGAYALCVLSKEFPEEMIVVRKASPLVVGKCDGEYFVASDIPAILEYTKDVYILEEDEVAHIKNKTIAFYNGEGNAIDKEITEITWDLESAEKQGYPHFMLKEIHEQPEAVEKTLAGRIKDGTVQLDLNLTDDFIKSIDKVAVVACGTASYAGRVGGNFIEKYLRIPVEAEFASEFRYNDPIITDKTLVIVVSQSGETADTLAGLREAKSKGAKIVAITNVVGSSIARESDEVIYTQAGPEIAVASTKAYVTQLIALYLLVLQLGKIRGAIDAAFEKSWIEALIKLPEQITSILEQSDIMEVYAAGLKDYTSAFFIGRGVDNVSSLEGALKLKEISYIHAEAYAAGELKHGTLALITDDVPVIGIATQKHLLEKSISNIIEVKARGAITYGIGFEGEGQLRRTVDHFYPIPDALEDFAPILTVVPLQLLAYYASLLKGNDVDKPRNLAKSVTVE